MRDLALLLFLLFRLPLLAIARLRGKKHPALLQRLGFFLPPRSGECFWIHAVSLGEVRAAKEFIRRVQKLCPEPFWLITCVTQTGLEEAKRSFPQAVVLYAPIDFSWTARKWVTHFSPSLFFSVESDIWPALLQALHARGSKMALISAKLSERSYRRWTKFSWIFRQIFAPLDAICVQDETQWERFSHLLQSTERLRVTGNLKFSSEPETVDPSWLLSMDLSSPFWTISSTHAPEEQWIFEQIQSLSGTFFFAPRHPERIPSLVRWLSQERIPFLLWSALKKRENIGPCKPRVILVDEMGQLPLCYSVSRAALVGGSFRPGVGGHNILEPSLYRTPVFFGPFMEGQKELVQHVLRNQLGAQVTLEELLVSLQEVQGKRQVALSDVSLSRTMRFLQEREFFSQTEFADKSGL